MILWDAVKAVLTYCPDGITKQARLAKYRIKTEKLRNLEDEHKRTKDQ